MAAGNRTTTKKNDSIARVKHLYKGYFRFLRVLYTERCYAYSERQAWLIFCRRIAKKQEVSPRMVMNKFDGSKENYRIDLEIEFQEVRDG